MDLPRALRRGGARDGGQPPAAARRLAAPLARARGDPRRPHSDPSRLGALGGLRLGDGSPDRRPAGLRARPRDARGARRRASRRRRVRGRARRGLQGLRGPARRLGSRRPPLTRRRGHGGPEDGSRGVGSTHPALRLRRPHRRAAGAARRARGELRGHRRGHARGGPRRDRGARRAVRDAARRPRGQGRHAPRTRSHLHPQPAALPPRAQPVRAAGAPRRARFRTRPALGGRRARRGRADRGRDRLPAPLRGRAGRDHGRPALDRSPRPALRRGAVRPRDPRRRRRPHQLRGDRDRPRPDRSAARRRRGGDRRRRPRRAARRGPNPRRPGGLVRASHAPPPAAQRHRRPRGVARARGVGAERDRAASRRATIRARRRNSPDRARDRGAPPPAERGHPAPRGGGRAARRLGGGPSPRRDRRAARRTGTDSPRPDRAAPGPPDPAVARIGRGQGARARPLPGARAARSLPLRRLAAGGRVSEPRPRGPPPRRRGLDAVTFAPRAAPTEDELARALAALGPTDPDGALDELGVTDPVAGSVAGRLRRAARTVNGLPGPLRSPAVLGELADRRLYGASTLEEYALCSYRWFVRHELRPQSIEPDPEPLAQGAILHEVLERLYLEPPGREKLPRPGDLDAWVARAGELLDEVAEAHGAPRDALGRVGRRRMLVLIECFLAREAESETPLRPDPDLIEASFGDGADDDRPSLDLGGLRLHGKIDRVDVAPGRRAGLVRDYKSGAKVTAAARLAKEGKLQPQLYMLALRELWGIDPIGGVYVPLAPTAKPEARGLLDKRERGELLDAADFVRTDFLEEDAFAEALDAARDRAAEIVTAMRRGVIDRDPIDDRCPHYCRFQPICRRERAVASEPASGDDEEEEA